VPAEAGDPITPEQIDEIYRTVIQPTLFGTTSGNEPSPTLVLLGGQPGSGKSRASTRLLAEYQGMVALSGDDLRIFHPRYRQLVEDQPERAGEVLAEATRPWVRAALQDSLTGRRSLLLESTFGDPNVTLATAARFREAGFHVRIVAIASPRILSIVTAASRYLRDRKADSPARFTRLSAHDRGYEGTARLIDSLDASVLVDQVTIVSRNGNTLFDHARDNETQPDVFDGASVALREGRHPTSWGARSTMELLGELKQITGYAIASRQLTADVADLLIEAHQLALSEVVAHLNVDADAPQARFIEQAVTEQLVALRRAISPEPQSGAALGPRLDVAGADIEVG
jgi:UDP-N-acetylglucosamine kinase